LSLVKASCIFNKLLLMSSASAPVASFSFFCVKRSCVLNPKARNKPKAETANAVLTPEIKLGILFCTSSA